MNEKLSNWASVAEIVSGIAVVVTLIFLILGIRENSDITRASMYGDHLNSLNQHSSDVYRDPELARIWEAWLVSDLSSLDDSDMQRLESMIATVFRTYEGAFLAQESGLYGEDEWERMQRVTCINFDRAQATDLVVLLEILMTRRFVEFMREGCR